MNPSLAILILATSVPAEPSSPTVEMIELPKSNRLQMRAFLYDKPMIEASFDAEYGEVKNGAYLPPRERPPLGIDPVSVNDKDGIPMLRILIYQPEKAAHLSTLEPTKSEKIAGITGVLLPLRPFQEYDFSKRLRVLSTGNSPLRIVKLNGILGLKPKGDPIEGATESIEGPWLARTFPDTHQWRRKKGELYPFKNENFVIHEEVTYRFASAKRVKYVDHYRASNGAWVFDHCKVLSNTGMKYVWAQPESTRVNNTTRVAWRDIFGFNANGFKWDESSLPPERL